MANRLFAYRAALESNRRGFRHGPPRRLQASEIGDLILRELAKAQRAGDRGIVDLDDYQLATRAGISVRQTSDLYEESGVGAFVRDVLDSLERERMITIARKSVSRRYHGILPTERALRSTRAMTWYARLWAFFEPPEELPVSEQLSRSESGDIRFR